MKKHTKRDAGRKLYPRSMARAIAERNRRDDAEWTYRAESMASGGDRAVVAVYDALGMLVGYL